MNNEQGPFPRFSVWLEACCCLTRPTPSRPIPPVLNTSVSSISPVPHPSCSEPFFYGVSCIPPVLTSSSPASHLFCIPPVLHPSRPAFLLVCIPPVLNPSFMAFPVSFQSRIPPFLYTYSTVLHHSFPASLLSTFPLSSIPPVLHRFCSIKGTNLEAKVQHFNENMQN